MELTIEHYELNWHGKANCMRDIHIPSQAILKPCREESINFDETDNIFIEGENLEVLKLLLESHSSKIKMIYIDPPYNTGNKMMYKDNFKDSKGCLHSDWLSMMYPRLYIARQLLRDDGVIFISIDDHEQANLKILCDQVFGEENFVGTLIWKRRVSSAMAENNVSIDHEYVIAYKKKMLKNFKGEIKNFKNYKNPDNDPRGPWISDNLTVGMTASMRPNQAYDLIDPKTKKIYPFNRNRVWAYIPESMKKLIESGRIIFPEDTLKRPMQKRFKHELKSDHNPFSTLMMEKVGLNTEGTRKLQSIMGSNIFKYSKPLSLLETLIHQTTEKTDIILDFFAGSSTTAHATMNCNSVDGHARKYICVQIPEPCGKKSEAYNAGYQTIADISKERIRRAALKIGEENPDKLQDLDLGFKVFKLESKFNSF